MRLPGGGGLAAMIWIDKADGQPGTTRTPLRPELLGLSPAHPFWIVYPEDGHGALFLGPRLPLPRSAIDQLPRFRVVLEGSRGKQLTGCGADVLDSPLTALAHLLDTLAADADAPHLSAGEIVTTGTLTDAAPIIPGDRWTTRLDGIDLPGATISFI